MRRCWAGTSIRAFWKRLALLTICRLWKCREIGVWGGAACPSEEIMETIRISRKPNSKEMDGRWEILAQAAHQTIQCNFETKYRISSSSSAFIQTQRWVHIGRLWRAKTIELPQMQITSSREFCQKKMPFWYNKPWCLDKIWIRVELQMQLPFSKTFWVSTKLECPTDLTMTAKRKYRVLVVVWCDTTQLFPVSRSSTFCLFLKGRGPKCHQLLE